MNFLPSVLRLTQGATFRVLLNTGLDLEGYAATSAASWDGGSSDLDVRLVDGGSGGVIELEAAPAVTATWPVGPVKAGVALTLGDERLQTEPLIINVLERIIA